MGYSLPANLHFCLSGGHAVFLDLAHDRYFRLGAALDATFQSLLQSGHGSEHDVEALARAGVIRAASAGEALSPPKLESASRSLLESTPLTTPPGLWTTLEVALSVAKTRLMLKLTPIARVLDRLQRAKARALAQGWIAPIGTQAEDVLGLALHFQRARRLVPIDTVCLLDSLALLDFLARRGLSARLVMGVKLNPFAAHCWVQFDDIILNDAFDRATAFNPILVL